VSNTISSILPTILARGLVALRQQAIMTRLVNRDLQTIAQSRGNVVNVPIPSAIAARAVTPAVTMAANVDSSPTSFPVTLDQWYESPIQLSDSDSAAIDVENFVNMQSSEAIKSLINTIDTYILGKAVGFFGYSGSAGSTPFNGSMTDAAKAKKVLSANLAPITDRRFVIDPSAEAQLIVVPEVLQTQMRGDSQGIINGTIGTKLGFDWYMDQNITTFTPGTGWVTGFACSTTTGVKGAKTLQVLNATASGTILVGDLFTLAADSKQYVVTAAATASSTVGVSLSIYPALSTSVPITGAGSTLAVVATAYTQNLAFHRDAWAFASRPLSGVFMAGNILQAPTDPISGVALRLELSRQYKQETLSYDALWGANIVRPELGSRVFG
jgi:hypothetical protein